MEFLTQQKVRILQVSVLCQLITAMTGLPQK